MEHTIKVGKNAYNVDICIRVCQKGTYSFLDEFDTKKEAKEAGYNEYDYDYWYLAAEVINERGDVNPACWGRTRKEALEKLKNAL